MLRRILTFSVGAALVGTVAGISPSSDRGLQSALKLQFSRVGKAFTLLDCLIDSLVGFLFRLSTFVMF